MSKAVDFFRDKSKRKAFIYFAFAFRAFEIKHKELLQGQNQEKINNNKEIEQERIKKRSWEKLIKNTYEIYKKSNLTVKNTLLSSKGKKKMIKDFTKAVKEFGDLIL